MNGVVEGLLLGKNEGSILRLGGPDEILDGTAEGYNVGMPL